MKFVKPTIEEVKKYIFENKLNVDSSVFYNYYEAQEWCDATGKPVRLWKGKCWTWHGRDKKTVMKATLERERMLAKEKKELSRPVPLLTDIASTAVKPIPVEENRSPLIQKQINQILKGDKPVPVKKPDKPDKYVPISEAESQRRLEKMKKQLLFER